jgi:hypothetical protein
MKTPRILIALLFIHTHGFSQVMAKPGASMAQFLKGTWYVVNSWPAVKDTLVFKHETKVPNNWGDRIEIGESGNIADAYSAPCGNDSRAHYTTGTWSLDDSTLILSTTIPIYLDRTKNKILKLTADSLILVRLDH